MRKSEERLRTLHPHAMARYDRLRADGLGPLDAMREALPLFGRDPDTRTGEPGPRRRSLDAPLETGVTWTADDAPRSPIDDHDAQLRARQAEQRGLDIIERLQARARAAGRPELGPDELATVLETVTNLPDETIVKLAAQAVDGLAGDVPDARRDTGTANAAHTVTRAERTAAQLAAESFPYTATQAINAAPATGPDQGPRRVSTTSQQPTAKPRRPI